MRAALLNFAVLVLILGGAFWLTNWFAGAMYNKCAGCGSLNAKRRMKCRVCGEEIGGSGQ